VPPQPLTPSAAYAYNTLCHEKYGEEITKIVPMKRRVF